jgi:hypothetical protein
MPFWKWESEEEPESILLAQTGPNRFELTRGFKYKAPDRIEPYPVPKDVSGTDLASVKWPVWWLVASYGMHTKAALLHDALIEPGPRYPKASRVERKKADWLFFTALKESNIGPKDKQKQPSWVRRWLMYSAVATIGTLRAEAFLRFLLFFAYLALFWTLVLWWVCDTWITDSWPISALDWWRIGLPWTILIVGGLGFFWPIVLFTKVNFRLGFGIWPTVLFASVFVLPPTILAGLVAFLVWVLDLVHNVAVAVFNSFRAVAKRDPQGVKDAFTGVTPPITPYRGTGLFQ